MKKIILSVAVATMALSTVASALEDIKVSGQAKLWYETQDAGTYENQSDTQDKSLFATEASTGEVVFKLGMTGKQGNVGFGATMYQASTMGLEGVVVGGVRTGDAHVGNIDDSDEYAFDGGTFIGEAYITAPLVASTILKFGKQELDTPLAFTETWNALPNTFNAAVLVNNSFDNLTLIGAYVGQGARGELDLTSQYYGGAFALAALYKTDAFGLNVWGYQINNVLGELRTSDGDTIESPDDLGQPLVKSGGVSVKALWADASVKAGVVNLTGYAAHVDHDGDDATATSAFALSAQGVAGPVTLFAAASTVSEGDLPVANTATGFKKSKLPTEGVYTDGLYVAQPGSTAFKLKASGKLGTTGLALQGVMNNNSGEDGEAMGLLAFQAQTLETTEVDLIISQKLGDFDLKAILMNRSFADDATDEARGGNHVRVIASVNF